MAAERTTIVAGGSGGLGRAVSLAFLEAGAAVVATFRRREELDALRVKAGAAAERLDGKVADVTDEAAARDRTYPDRRFRSSIRSRVVVFMSQSDSPPA